MFRFLFALAALAVFVPSSANACPNCVKGLATEQANSTGDSAGAFNASILFMLGVPMAVLGFFGTAAWRLSRERDAMPRVFVEPGLPRGAAAED